MIRPRHFHGAGASQSIAGSPIGAPGGALGAGIGCAMSAGRSRKRLISAASSARWACSGSLAIVSLRSRAASLPSLNAAVAAESGWTRRYCVEHLLGYGELGWLERGGQRIERLALIGGRLPLHGRTLIAAHRVDVILARDHRRGGLDGIAMIHVDGHQRL